MEVADFNCLPFFDKLISKPGFGPKWNVYLYLLFLDQAYTSIESKMIDYYLKFRLCEMYKLASWYFFL